MSLTGGLDTRMIMAWKGRRARSLPCYTFGGMFRENHDVRWAGGWPACNQPYQVITAGKEFLARFPYYAERAGIPDGWMRGRESVPRRLSK